MHISVDVNLKETGNSFTQYEFKIDSTQSGKIHQLDRASQKKLRIDSTLAERYID